MNFQAKEYPGTFAETIVSPKNGSVFAGANYDELIQSFDSAADRDPNAAPHPDTLISQPGVRSGIEVLCLADVKAKPIEWLWPNWIAIGKVSILAGEGGKGKSTILCDLAARTTRGIPWPDSAEASSPGDVIILAAEDDIEDTLAPRLIAAGADMSRVFNIRAVRNDDLSRRSFNLQADLGRLEAEIKSRENVRLVIIDPVSSHISGRVLILTRMRTFVPSLSQSGIWRPALAPRSFATITSVRSVVQPTTA